MENLQFSVGTRLGSHGHQIEVHGLRESNPEINEELRVALGKVNNEVSDLWTVALVVNALNAAATVATEHGVEDMGHA